MRMMIATGVPVGSILGWCRRHKSWLGGTWGQSHHNVFLPSCSRAAQWLVLCIQADVCQPPLVIHLHPFFGETSKFQTLFLKKSNEGMQSFGKLEFPGPMHLNKPLFPCKMDRLDKNFWESTQLQPPCTADIETLP